MTKQIKLIIGTKKESIEDKINLFLEKYPKAELVFSHEGETRYLVIYQYDLEVRN